MLSSSSDESFIRLCCEECPSNRPPASQPRFSKTIPIPSLSPESCVRLWSWKTPFPMSILNHALFCPNQVHYYSFSVCVEKRRKNITLVSTMHPFSLCMYLFKTQFFSSFCTAALFVEVMSTRFHVATCGLKWDSACESKKERRVSEFFLDFIDIINMRGLNRIFIVSLIFCSFVP